MKLFRIKGGVHPQGFKALSASDPIRKLPLPPSLSLPMLQHIGIEVRPMVEVGQHVDKGQVLGMCAGEEVCKHALSAPVHAPTSGTVVAIDRQRAPHPSGLPEMMVTLEPDGADRWGERLAPLDPATASPDELARRIHQCGIVGMGGAMFPTAAKLEARRQRALHTLLINGAECEPYLTADDRLMREGAANIVDGIHILQTLLGVPRVLVAIEDNKGEALAAMQKAAAALPEIEVVAVPTAYPMGSEKHLVKVLTGREVPSGGLPAALGFLVNNIATAHAVHEAVRFGQPLISRIVTVSGGAVRRPGNYEVLPGTKISDLLAMCGGLKSEPAQILAGGPMMGMPVSDTDVPVTKGTNGVLALTRSEMHPGRHRPCIRCGACVSACPCGLQPLELASLVRNGKIEAAEEAGLGDCILCGACSFVCPSHIPLVQYFNHGKGEMAEMRREMERAARLKKLSDERKKRDEKKAAAKRAKQQARKAAIAARKAAETAQKADAQTATGNSEGKA